MFELASPVVWQPVRTQVGSAASALSFVKLRQKPVFLCIQAELLHVLPTAASCRRPADRGDTARLFTDHSLNVRLQNGLRVRSLRRWACRAQHMPISSTFDQLARGIWCPPSARHAVPGLAQFMTHFGWFYGFGTRGRGFSGGAAHAGPKCRGQSVFYATRGVAPSPKNTIPLRLDTRTPTHATVPPLVPATVPEPKKTVEHGSHNRLLARHEGKSQKLAKNVTRSPSGGPVGEDTQRLIKHARAMVTGSAPSAPAIAAPPLRRRPERVPSDAGGGRQARDPGARSTGAHARGVGVGGGTSCPEADDRGTEAGKRPAPMESPCASTWGQHVN